MSKMWQRNVGSINYKHKDKKEKELPILADYWMVVKPNNVAVLHNSDANY